MREVETMQFGSVVVFSLGLLDFLAWIGRFQLGFLVFRTGFRSTGVHKRFHSVLREKRSEEEQTLPAGSNTVHKFAGAHRFYSFRDASII